VGYDDRTSLLPEPTDLLRIVLQVFRNASLCGASVPTTDPTGLGDRCSQRLRGLQRYVPAHTEILKEEAMQIHSRRAVAFCLFAFTTLAVLANASAEDKDVVHIVSGVVKHVDKGSRKVVVKAGDGTEHTIKWTGKTTWHGTKDAGEGIKEGSQLTVHYTEKAGEKTAVGVEDVGKDTKKALQ
jgi:hypothetical protein